MLRVAKIDDKANIAALLIQVWLHTYATKGLRNSISRYVLNEFTEENIEQDMRSENKQYFVAEEKQHLVGVVVVDLLSECPMSNAKLPELTTLYVQEYFTGRGIGASLLEMAIEYCHSLNFPKLWLTVNSENGRAIDFYSALGFTSLGVIGFSLEDETHENLVMEKLILPIVQNLI